MLNSITSLETGLKWPYEGVSFWSLTILVILNLDSISDTFASFALCYLSSRNQVKPLTSLGISLKKRWQKDPFSMVEILLVTHFNYIFETVQSSTFCYSSESTQDSPMTGFEASLEELKAGLSYRRFAIAVMMDLNWLGWVVVNSTWCYLPARCWPLSTSLVFCLEIWDGGVSPFTFAISILTMDLSIWSLTGCHNALEERDGRLFLWFLTILFTSIAIFTFWWLSSAFLAMWIIGCATGVHMKVSFWPLTWRCVLNLNFIFDVATYSFCYPLPMNWQEVITRSGTSFREHVTRVFTQFVTMWVKKIVKICVGSTESFWLRHLPSRSWPKLISSEKSLVRRVREESFWLLLSMRVMMSLDYDIKASGSFSSYLSARSLLKRITSSETSWENVMDGFLSGSSQ